MRKNKATQFSFARVLMCLFLMSLFLSTAGRASEKDANTQLLLEITSDLDDEVTKLIVETGEEGDAVQLIKRSFNSKGKLINEEVMGPELLASENGMLLEERKDRHVVTLRSDNFSSHNGGNIEIDTLYNGATGKRKSYYVDMARRGDKWNIFLQNQVVVERVHLKVKKVFVIGVVGIEDVAFNKEFELEFDSKELMLSRNPHF